VEGVLNLDWKNLKRPACGNRRKWAAKGRKIPLHPVLTQGDFLIFCGFSTAISMFIVYVALHYNFFRARFMQKADFAKLGIKTEKRGTKRGF
jgi:hypothetical protein